MPEGVALHIVIQGLVRVEVRAVPREDAEPEPIGPLRHPARDLRREVHRLPVEDEEHRAAGVPKLAAEEPEEHPIRKRLPEHHEGESAPVGDRGEHIAPEPLPRPRNRRRLPSLPVGGACLSAVMQYSPPVVIENSLSPRLRTEKGRWKN